ncbi:hypothetical protein NE652_00075 [Bifidobacterium pseudocatenulatum]|nr:hypothetical protein [Bifidobacterium pseudocatenulatum]
MKNNTFNQIINANLASVDPGFGQFALAKASADLFKKVINKCSKARTGRRPITTTEGLALHVARKPFLMFRSSDAKNPATPATAHTAPHATTHNSWCFT